MGQRRRRPPSGNLLGSSSPLRQEGKDFAGRHLVIVFDAVRRWVEGQLELDGGVNRHPVIPAS